MCCHTHTHTNDKFWIWKKVKRKELTKVFSIAGNWIDGWSLPIWGGATLGVVVGAMSPLDPRKLLTHHWTWCQWVCSHETRSLCQRFGTRGTAPTISLSSARNCSTPTEFSPSPFPLSSSLLRNWAVVDVSVHAPTAAGFLCWLRRSSGKMHLGLRRWSFWAMKIVLRSLVVMALDSEKRILLLHKPSSFVYGVYAKREEDFYSLQKM